jgi:hypothetical protein
LLAFRAVQVGLSIRQARARKQPQPPGAMGSHLKVAKPGVIILVVAFFLGLGSAYFVRHFKLFDSTHAWLGLVATVGFAATGLIGTGLVNDRAKRRSLHVAFSLLGLGSGLIAALTGIPMLP